MKQQLRSFDEWVEDGAVVREAVESEVEIPDGVTIPSTGYTKGQRHIGPVPPGRYKVWRDELRAKNMLIPIDQESPSEPTGSVYYMDAGTMKDIKDLQAGTYKSFGEREKERLRGYEGRKADTQVDKPTDQSATSDFNNIGIA